MKEAPDKIYLHEEDFTRIYTQPSSIIDDDIEYIRKEALLEWLEDMRFMANSERVGAYQNVIDKLNEM